MGNICRTPSISSDCFSADGRSLAHARGTLHMPFPGRFFSLLSRCYQRRPNEKRHRVRVARQMPANAN